MITDKTAGEIYAAFEAGVNIRVRIGDSIGALTEIWIYAGEYRFALLDYNFSSDSSNDYMKGQAFS